MEAGQHNREQFMKNSHSFFVLYLGIALMSLYKAGRAQQISPEAASEGL
jgi:hypothetical protein